MSTNYEEAVAEFLAQKENIRFALEIAANLDLARKRIVLSFWSLVEEKLRAKLSEDIEERWELKADQNMDARYPGINIIPTGATSPRFIYRLERDTNFYNKIWAQGQDDIKPEERQHLVYKEAVKNANELGWVTKDDSNRGIGWGYCGRTFHSQDAMIIEMAENGDVLCEGIVKKASEDFRASKELILKLNNVAIG